MSSRATVRSALITGASSGIGRALTQELAARGWRVFAGYRRHGHETELAQLGPGVRPVRLDVTSAEHVAAAGLAVRAELSGTGLDVLVHNAGIVVPGPLELLTVADLRESFEVNLFGVQRVTTEFLPLLRTSRGRLIGVSSISGRVGFPFEGAYNASKFALEGWADTLRRELDDVAVVLVEPGPVRTPIWARLRERWRQVRATGSSELVERYRGPIEAWERELEDVEQRAVPVSAAVAALLRAMLEAAPRPRYVVGGPARLWSIAARFAPTRWVDRRLRIPGA